ncbi:hypothetical protein CAFE_09660 [Caprobacter fermentans]|uniref:Uncharacterized protein n=1 Tax=Caproicibacter fermentans TaxID=2576756 RepID=A0A6N8HWR7_9FIRM|nr:hypothetical protein [Caproicibacter fermentans]MVB10284.1 hypothetical protein [Caproicibacter fermentans]
MLKSKSKKLVALCCVVALMVTCAVPAFAAAVSWSTTFPAFKSWTDVKSGTKSTTYAANNTVAVSIDNYDSYASEGEFFARAYYNGGWHDVSQSKAIYASQAQDLILNDPSATNGITLMLVGRNQNISAYNVSARGTVDFH